MPSNLVSNVSEFKNTLKEQLVSDSFSEPLSFTFALDADNNIVFDSETVKITCTSSKGTWNGVMSVGDDYSEELMGLKASEEDGTTYLTKELTIPSGGESGFLAKVRDIMTLLRMEDHSSAISQGPVAFLEKFHADIFA